MKMQRTCKSRVFTLVEMLVVLAIIGMLVGIAGPAIMGRMRGAEINTAKTQVKVLDEAVMTYYMDVREFPKKLEDLVTGTDGGDSKWKGPYLKPAKVPKDPWGTEYQYEWPAAHNKKSPDIYSYGPDKAAGGEGDAADITNWD